MMQALARSLLLVLGLALLTSARAETRDPDTHFFNPFLGDLRDELAQARGSGRKGVLVMYHFDDCPACKRMRREVLNQAEVQDWFRQAFVIVPIDILGAQPITDLNGKTRPERDYGRAMNIRATPTFDFYALDGAHVYRHVGGLFSPQDFLRLGQFIVSGAYQGRTFKEYRQSTVKGN
jgi:thioredoxin-related protein